MLKLFNTISRKKESFKPLHRKNVGLYTCGPTVYSFAHIGNLRTYIFDDILRRTLEYSNYNVKHVMNITDVGHLTSDADTGEDKLDQEAKKESKSVWDIAKYYTEIFLNDLEKLNIKKAHVLAPATKNIKEQIKLISKLLDNGHAYETKEAIYFNVSQFKTYTKLSRQKLVDKQVGVRDEVVIDSNKKNPQDFALWFKVVGRFKNHTMRWKSPWGVGFPGWHIECSAISTKYLGQPFDIHTGGVDHINVHHTNEIAQSEGAFNKPLAKYWMHGEFLIVDQTRMGKSEGNFVTLANVVEKNFNPLAFRYLVLTAHYRSQLNFTWDSIEAAENSLEHFYDFIRNLKYSKQTSPIKNPEANLKKIEKGFREAIFNDLETPKAIALIWDLVHAYNKNPDNFNPKQVLKLLYKFDQVLGLKLNLIKPTKTPPKLRLLLLERARYRKNKDWLKADQIRKKIDNAGYLIIDSESGPKLKKK